MPLSPLNAFTPGHYYQVLQGNSSPSTTGSEYVVNLARGCLLKIRLACKICDKINHVQTIIIVACLHIYMYIYACILCIYWL